MKLDSVGKTFIWVSIWTISKLAICLKSSGNSAWSMWCFVVFMANKCTGLPALCQPLIIANIAIDPPSFSGKGTRLHTIKIALLMFIYLSKIRRKMPMDSDYFIVQRSLFFAVANEQGTCLSSWLFIISIMSAFYKCLCLILTTSKQRV